MTIQSSIALASKELNKEIMPEKAFVEILKRPISWAMVLEMIQFLGTVWIAFFLGVMVGWAWKPRWASLGNCKFEFSAPLSPSASIYAPVGSFDSTQNLDPCKIRAEGFNSTSLDNGLEKNDRMVLPAIDDDAVWRMLRRLKMSNAVMMLNKSAKRLLTILQILLNSLDLAGSYLREYF